MEINQITNQIIAAAIEVHRTVGPGLLETAYETCLYHELCLMGLQVERQIELPVIYKGIRVEGGYRVDLLVEDQVVVEVKSVQEIHPVHEAQVITYLRLGGWSVGLLINFHVPVLKHGIRRLINGPEGFMTPMRSKTTRQPPGLS